MDQHRPEPARFSDQLRGAVGSDWLSRIAQATGLPQDQVEQHVSTLLPQVVDHLTPDGQLPQGEIGGELAKWRSASCTAERQKRSA